MLLERKRERFLQVVVEPGCGWRRQGDYRYTYSIPSERNDRNSYDKYLGVDAIRATAVYIFERRENAEMDVEGRKEHG